MKRSTLITIISLLIPLLGMSQTKAAFVDDLYLKPSDAQAIQKSQSTDQAQKKPNYKNGAKEIIYLERENPKTKEVHDTLYVVGEANDSTENNQEQGHYLNGFKGTQSDLEYAERIRRFHNPRYEIFIGDPRYNDIYFLNDWDWNVYVDGSYAYVTPTWTNPYWWNYNSNPYSYGSFGFGYNNFYSPWGYDNFYGGFGYGGFGYGGFGYGGLDYGYGYGGYGYGGYGYGYGGYCGYGGYGYTNWGNARKPSHDEASRRQLNNVSASGRVGGTNSSSQTMIGGGGNYSTNPYTVVNSRSQTGSQSAANTGTGLRSTNLTRSSTVRSIPTNTNGIGVVRTGGLRNWNGANQTNTGRNQGTRTSTSYSINTTPRTSITRNSPSGGNSNQTIVNSSPTRISNSTTTTSNSRNYSTSTRSSSPSSSYSPNRSSSSYNSGNSNNNSGSSNNSSRSSSSYSSGSSSSGSSSNSSSGSSSGGSRSSGGGSGGRR